MVALPEWLLLAVLIVLGVTLLRRCLNAAGPKDKAEGFPFFSEAAPQATTIYDCIVVGGGPSGSTAARRAAQGGASVLLFEKSRMPRRKLCGGALSNHAKGYLDFDLPEELVDARVLGGRVHYGERSIEAVSKSFHSTLVTRSHFDHFLLQKAQEAGAQVRFARIDKIEDDGRIYRVTAGEEHFYCRGLIIAEGVIGRFGKQIQPIDPKTEMGFCLEADVDIEDAEHFEDIKDKIDIYFGVANFGYGWIFHHGSYLSVGIGGLCSLMPDTKQAMRDFLQDHGFDPVQKSQLGHYIPLGGIPRRLHAGRCLLSGDAGGLVDPFSGEGLAYAIRSGAIAGEEMALAASQDNFSAQRLKRYGQRCRKELNPNLRYALLVAKLMHAYPSLFFRVLTSDRVMMEKFLDLATARRSYRSMLFWVLLRTPLILLRSLGNRSQ